MQPKFIIIHKYHQEKLSQDEKLKQKYLNLLHQLKKKFERREFLLNKIYKMYKNYNKMHENSQVTYKIMKIISVLTYEYIQNFINFNPNLQNF